MLFNDDKGSEFQMMTAATLLNLKTLFKRDNNT